MPAIALAVGRAVLPQLAKAALPMAESVGKSVATQVIASPIKDAISGGNNEPSTNDSIPPAPQSQKA
jgi:hypothetical protein